MPHRTPPSSRLYRALAARRHDPRRWGAGFKLDLLEFEARSMPSVSIPLSGTAWTEIGPKPIAAQNTGDSTSSPGNLTSTGRASGVATNPTDPNIIYVATTGGGVAKTTDGGKTWAMVTDRLPGLTDAQRNLQLGSIAISPVKNAGGTYDLFAGEGELDFSGDSYTGKGILKSSDDGKTWSLIEGPGQAFVDVGIPRIVVVKNPADATKQIIYAAITGSQAGAISRLNATVAFAGAATVNGAAKPNGVYRSDDNGATWVNTTAKLNSVNQVSPAAAITDIAVDPTNPDILYTAVGDPSRFDPNVSYRLNGIYKTVNATAAAPDWIVAFGGNGTFVPGSKLGRIQIAIAPSRPSTIYAVVADPNTDGLLGVYRSQESGTNWRQFGNVPNFLPAQSSYNVAIIVNPTDENNLTLLGTLDQMVITTGDALNPNPNAVTWTNISRNAAGKGPHVDGHTLAYDAAGRLIVGSDGGVFRADTLIKNGLSYTVDWSSLNGTPGKNTGLNAAQYIGIALNPSSAETFLGGLQDNGTTRFVDNGNPLDNTSSYGQSNVDGGDGGAVVYDFVDPNNAYRVSPVGSFGAANFVRKSTNGGRSFSSATTGIVNAGSAQFYPPLEIDPSNSQRVLLGTDVLNATLNGAASWAQLGPTLPYVTGVAAPDGPIGISHIGIGRFDGNVIYAAVPDRVQNINGFNVHFGPALYLLNLNLTANFATGFPAWQDVSPGVATTLMAPIQGAPTNPLRNTLAGAISDIAVDPNDSNIVYLTIDSPNGAKILRSTNAGGLAPPTWVDITGTGANALPRRPVSIVIDPNRLRGSEDDDIYVGTEIGVYKLSNPTLTTYSWSRVGGDSFPDVRVNDLQINTSIGILAAGTNGRGVWQYQIRPLVSGFKFEDVNGDGVRNVDPTTGAPTERGLPGITITVRSGSPTGPEVASTVTRSGGFFDGYWEFRSLPDGIYYIQEEGVTGYQQTTPIIFAANVTNGVASNITQTYQLLNQGIGNFARTSISGVKYDDINGNGVKDAGESGLPGFTIQLFDVTGAPVLDAAGKQVTQVTAADGSYTFANLGITAVADRTKRNQYILKEVQQPNYVATQAPTGAITILSGTPVTDVNFGNFKRFTITGIKFNDLNGNGAFDSGEPPLQNWVFQLFDSTDQPIVGTDGLQLTSITNAAGVYQFTNLGPLPGGLSYRVKEIVQPGWQQITPIPSDIPNTSGAVISNVNFGNFRLVQVTGNVFDDTNGDGIRQATETTPVGGGSVSLVYGGTSVQSVPVKPDGTFTFTNVKPIVINGVVQAYQITINPAAGYVATTPSPSVPPFTVTSGNSQSGFTFGVFKRTTIAGLIFEDINGNGVQDAGETALGVAGSKVSLIDTITGKTVATQTVGGDGTFTFAPQSPTVTGGAVDPYVVQFVPASGYTFTQTDKSDPFFLTSGIPFGPVTFGAFKLTTISGQVLNDLNGDGAQQSNESGGVAGAIVTLIDSRNNQPVAGVAPITVGADGKFTFNNLGPLLSNGVNAAYRVVATPPAGWLATGRTTADVVLFSGRAVGNQIFPEFKLFTISGVAYDDKNFNGVRNPGEPGLAGVTVRLRNVGTGAVETTTTDAGGFYQFANRGPGVYNVREDAVPGAIPTSTNPADIAGVSGQDVPNISFGNFKLIAVTGKVTEDLNRDGTLAATEPGSAGWVVSLVNTATGATVATQTTAADGLFNFTGITPGTYVVQLTPRDSWLFTAPRPVPAPPASPTYTFTTVSGTVAGGNNFGVLKLGSYSSFAFLDANRNGVLDSREKRLPGITIVLRDAATTNIVQQATTGANGGFTFNNLEPGNYLISIPGSPQFILTGKTLTGSGVPITVASGSADPNSTLTQPVIGVGSIPVTVVGADAGGGPNVKVFNSLTGELKYSFFAYESSFTGGVRVAVADVNGDGVEDFITVAGPGGGPRVQAFDGVSLRQIFDFYAYEPSFTGGLFISAGDVNGDGVADIITGTDAGGGPRVQVFDGLTQQPLQNYFAFEESFRGGVRVAGGDVNGDGLADIIATPAVGGGPRVTVRNGKDGTVLNNFFAFDDTYRGGITVAAGDILGNGTAQVIIGQGASPDPHVRLFTATGQQLADAQALPVDVDGVVNTSEVRVGTTDRGGDGTLNIIVTTGPGSRTRLRFLDQNLQPIADELSPYDRNFTGGVFVG